MRGSDGMQEALFTVAKLDDFIPLDHPLRRIRLLVNEALVQLNGLFNEIYADEGRPSIAPEKLLRASLLQVFYSVRSERQLCEQLHYNLLFRWFVGLAMDDAVWDHSVFSKNRERLLEHSVVEAFFREVMRLADAKGLLSKEHFSVDGTLIQAWASHKSFKPKGDGGDEPPAPGRNAEVSWKGKPRTNDTHQSTTDPDARLFRKGDNTGALLCYQGHVLMENRSGLVVAAVVTQAHGKAEREAALAMLNTVPGSGRKSIGGDKNYDTKDFVAQCRGRQITPHLAVHTTRSYGKSTIDARTTRHHSYALSQIVRKRVEEHFGWAKTIGHIRQTVYRGLRRVDQHFKLTMTASNIVRMARITSALPLGAAR